MLLEREIREAELIVDGQSFRADIERLQRLTGMQLYEPTLLDALPDTDDTSAAAKLQGAIFLKEIEGSPIPSHQKMFHPCWVSPISKLRELTRLPRHEDALNTSLLDELTATSTQPSSAYRYVKAARRCCARMRPDVYFPCLPTQLLHLSELGGWLGAAAP